MRNSLLRMVMLSVFALLAKNAIAQQPEPIAADRPDQTESTVTVPKKYFQAEIGFSYEKINKQVNSTMLPSCLFKYGITDKTEFRLITEVERLKESALSNTGLNPVAIGFKTKLVEEKGIIPDISFLGHISLAHVASSKRSSTYYAPRFRLSLAHTVSKRISLGYNFGAEWDGESAEPTFIYTLTTGISVSEKLGSFIELYGFLPQRSSADHRMDAGLSFWASRDILFDIAGGVGLNDNASTYFIGAGVSFRFR